MERVAEYALGMVVALRSSFSKDMAGRRIRLRVSARGLPARLLAAEEEVAVFGTVRGEAGGFVIVVAVGLVNCPDLGPVLGHGVDKEKDHFSKSGSPPRLAETPPISLH